MVATFPREVEDAMEHRSSKVSSQRSTLQEVSYGRGVHSWCRSWMGIGRQSGACRMTPRPHRTACRQDHRTQDAEAMTPDLLAVLTGRPRSAWPMWPWRVRGAQRPVYHLLEDIVTIWLRTRPT